MLASSSSEDSGRRVSSPFRLCTYFVVTFCAFLLCTPHSLAAITFTKTQIASRDSRSNSIVSGDFNNDGIVDLVTCNNVTISFYKGLGGDRYAAPVNTPFSGTGAILQSSAADFNRDGKLDLAVASFYGGVSILLGEGDGRFTFHTSLSFGESVTTAVALADFNGDHIPDIVMNDCPTHSPFCTLVVFLGLANGSFQQSATLQDGGNAAFVTGDFNADGHQDIAALTPEIGGINGVTLYLGKGTGRFQSPITFATPATSALAGLAVGDFYNDRIQSLALATEVSQSSTSLPQVYVQTIRYSNGKLTSTKPQVVFTKPSTNSVTLASGDLNGDFKDDLVIMASYGTNPSKPIAVYLLGTGVGTFHAPVSLPTAGLLENTPFVRDLNLDSRHDIGAAWSNQTAGGAVVLTNTDATALCAPPAANKLSVHICAPANGQTVTSTFTFRAAGNAFNGIAKRMELWIDGKKVGQNLEDQLKVTAILSPGTHKASFVVVDSFDKYKSQSVTFSAK